MIHTTSQVRGIVEEAIGARCYLEYPQKELDGVYAILQLIDDVPVTTDRRGADITVQITYNIMIHARSGTELMELTDKVDDAMASHRYKRIGLSSMWSGKDRNRMRTITYQAYLDRWNNVFSGVR